MITIIVSRKQNFPRQDWRGWRHVGKMAKRGLPAFLLPALIMIFLFLGIGTIVEVGATSCLIAIILASLYGEMTPKKLLKMLMHTSIMAATCYAMVGFSGLYTWIITSMGVAKWIAAQILAAGASKLAVCSVAMLILFILGMILDTLVLQMVMLEAGADIAFTEGIDSREAIQEIGERVPGWKMFGMSSKGASPKVSCKELNEWGYNLVTCHFAFAGAYRGMWEFGQKTLQDKSDVYAYDNDLLNGPMGAFELFNIHEWLGLAQEFNPEIKTASRFTSKD